MKQELSLAQVKTILASSLDVHCAGSSSAQSEEQAECFQGFCLAEVRLSLSSVLNTHDSKSSLRKSGLFWD